MTSESEWDLVHCRRDVGYSVGRVEYRVVSCVASVPDCLAPNWIFGGSPRKKGILQIKNCTFNDAMTICFLTMYNTKLGCPKLIPKEKRVHFFPRPVT